MFNLPSDSTINNCEIFHEGNHNEFGNPHEQYICSTKYKYTVNPKSEFGKWVKIATVKYIPNTNVGFRYKFKLYPLNSTLEYDIDVLLKNENSNAIIKMKTDGDIMCAIKQDTEKDDNGNSLLVNNIYIQIKRTWFVVHYDLVLAENTRYYHYNDGYARKCIELHKEQALVNELTSDITVQYEYFNKYVEITNEATTINANETKLIPLSVSGVNWDCYLSIVPCGVIPLELSWDYEIPYTNVINIRVCNYQDYVKEFPALKWKIIVRKSN